MRQRPVGLRSALVLAVALGTFMATVGVAAAHGWKAPADASKIQNPIPGTEASIQRGRDVFQNSCASCHGENARGKGPLSPMLTPKPADLLKRAKHHTQGDFFWKISNGRPPMPGFKDQLSEKQIWDAINYIYGLRPD